MSFRRWVPPLTLVLGAACSDGIAPPTPHAVAPHLLRWAGSSAPRFGAVGAVPGGRRFPGGSQLVSLTEGAPPVLAENASSATANASSLAWSYTVGSGANRFLLVGVSIRDGHKTVTGATYAGQALTFLGARNDKDNAVRVELWYLVAPPSGTATVALTLSGAAKVAGGAASFTAVDPLAPLGAFASAGSNREGSGASFAVHGLSDGMAVSVVATEGAAHTLTPTTRETGQLAVLWTQYSGAGPGDIAAGGSTFSSDSSATIPDLVSNAPVPMGWSILKKASWAIGGVVLNRAHPLVPAVQSNEVSFWAVRGQSRSVEIDYVAANDTSPSPFLTFTATDPTYVPGRGDLEVGDSVLITARVDTEMVAVTFEPSGLQFGTPASLTIWYGGIGGDLNGDGVVDGTDSFIAAKLLGLWYRESETSPWSPIAATQSVPDKRFTTSVPHFTGYAVAW